jgi:NADPH-dependent 2,4-dienoyl-CoA reductase/sulfur reductase-like enzyme/rhodanese-related sulfurtransferase
VGGEIADRNKLLVASPELFKNRFNINVKLQHEVVSIDPVKKLVKGEDLASNSEFILEFDKLIVSTGSKLIKLPIFKDGLKNVFTLWSMKDLDASMDFIKKTSPKHATVIGAGFVGLELVEQLKHRGIKVSLIEKSPQVLPPLDPEIAQFLEEELTKHDIDLNINTEVTEVIESSDSVSKLVLANGKEINTDLIFVGIGVRPETNILKDSGITLGAGGGVLVDEMQRTNYPDIYAVGDMSESFYAPTNEHVVIPLAGPANKAGRIAGEHATTNESQFKSKVYGTSIVRVFSKTAGLTGLSEKLCIRKNITHKTAYISAGHHAGYFPGAKELVLKLIYDPETSKILGAEGIGEEGVDKRLDIIATLLHFSGKVSDLAELDLSYAPPFGSAKDPVHQLAFVALNDLDKFPETLAPNTDLTDYQVVDVRTQKERDQIPLPGSIHIPIDDPAGKPIEERITHLDKSKPTVITCHSGKRAHIVASILQSAGFSKVYNITGGMMIRSRIL